MEGSKSQSKSVTRWQQRIEKWCFGFACTAFLEVYCPMGGSKARQGSLFLRLLQDLLEKCWSINNLFAWSWPFQEFETRRFVQSGCCTDHSTLGSAAPHFIAIRRALTAPLVSLLYSAYSLIRKYLLPKNGLEFLQEQYSPAQAGSCFRIHQI